MKRFSITLKDKSKLCPSVKSKQQKSDIEILQQLLFNYVNLWHLCTTTQQHKHIVWDELCNSFGFIGHRIITLYSFQSITHSLKEQLSIAASSLVSTTQERQSVWCKYESSSFIRNWTESSVAMPCCLQSHNTSLSDQYSCDDDDDVHTEGGQYWKMQILLPHLS